MIDPKFTKYTEFVPHVQIDVMNCPKNVIVDAIRKVSIEFCQISNYWRHEMEPMDLIKDETDYEFEPFDQTVVTTIRSMVTDNGRVFPTTEEEQDRSDHNWRDKTDTRPNFYIPLLPGFFRLVPFPTDTVPGVLKILVALAPTRESTQVWEDIFIHHLLTITHGAQAMLLGMSEKTWTDHALADKRERQYRKIVGSARVDAIKGYSSRTLHAHAREFGF